MVIIKKEIDKKKKLNETKRLKELILKKETKKEYVSEKFRKIEQKVKESLKKQDTDEALKDLTLWAIFLLCSDIHYECYEEKVLVRFRIDWILVDIFYLTKKEYKKITERLKYSSNLKLNIISKPQDWKYNLKINWKQKIDIRVSTLPSKYGENIVCRILNPKDWIIDFDNLWFFWTSKRLIEKTLLKRNWMILVTWPTGSGKSTTLYTILKKLNSRDKKIITLEDPIEYDIPWVIQSEINEKEWLTFNSWLKAILRQDPDIIMIWEIRDFETLNTATWASLTGHLVLSTLHTKSAADTLDRIINMWLKPYILASALDTIIAQRLVRKICNNCKVEKQKTKQEKTIIETMMNEIWMRNIPIKNMKLYKWNGCEECNNSWFKWRIWLYEIINLNDNIREIIRWWWSVADILEEAKNWWLITMKEDGILKAIKWHTTIEEILRVI